MPQYYILGSLEGSGYPFKVIYGVSGTPSGIESAWYVGTTVKANEALLPSSHYLWEVKLSNDAFGRVRSVKRFDGNYVYARSVKNAGGGVTITTWNQNVARQIVRSESQQLISSRRQLLDGTWETNVDYTAADFLPPTAYQLPASAGVPLRTQSVQRDPATDMVTRRDYPDGTHELYEYNAFNQMTKFTDRNGNVEEWEYNVTGDLEKHTVAVGTAIEADEHWTYNAKGQVLTYEDFNTNVTTYEYYPAAHAAQFELKKIILPNGAGQPAGEIVFTYDSFGHVKTVTDPVGRISTFDYDAAGRHIKTTYADTSTEETVYDTGVKSAQVLKTIDRNGNETKFTYDATGRKETRKVHQGATATVLTTTTLTYTASTGLLLSSDTDGDVTEYEYDYLNRTKKTTVYPQAAQPLVMENVFNRYRLEKTIDYYGRATNYTYDDLDRILSRIVELKAGGATITTSTEYDDNGNVEAGIDGNGNRTEYQYDERNRQIETKYAVGSPVEATTHTEYDDNSNATKFTDERTHDWVSTYTVRNQLKTQTNPEGDTTSTTYTADTLVATVTNANSHVTTTSYYACCARIEKITDDDGFFKTFEYDFNGNRTKLTDESGRVVTCEYDGLNRRTKQRVDPTGLNLITLTSYDITPGVIGQTTTTTSPAAQVVTTKVDGLGRTSIVSGDTAKVTYTYDVVIGMGADTGLVKTTVTTDPDTLALTRSQLTDGAGRTIKALDSFGNADSFTYDNDDNMLTATDRDGKVTTNTYDQRDRQKTSQGDTGGIAATTTTVYDDTYNVETITDAQSKVTKYTYDDASVVANPQTYDQNFSQTDDGATFLFEYDANDMLKTVKNRATMAVIAEYRYDALNRRIEKNVGGAITRYYQTGQRVVEERDGTDVVTAFYTFGNYIDSRLTMDRGGARHYYHENRMYSTYVMTDNTGAVAERYAYTGYGVVTTYNAAYGAPQTTFRLGNPYAFTGRELDAETLLYNYRGRIFGPVEGRFKQLDPIGYGGGSLNLFAYVDNRTTTFLDASGLAPSTFQADVVAKSFINGIPSIGSLKGYVGPTDRPNLTQILNPGPTPKDPTVDATGRLNAFAAVVGTLPAFNENPLFPNKDGKYRLYTRATIEFCCDGDRIVGIKVPFTDMEGGHEVALPNPYYDAWLLDYLIPPESVGISPTIDIYGTINMSPPNIVSLGPSTSQVSWQGWGRPNYLVEPGMQAVAYRTSVNIWHNVTVELSCKGGKGFDNLTSLRKSKFPSHRVWINKVMVADKTQGAFSDLWDPVVGNWWFVTE